MARFESSLRAGLAVIATPTLKQQFDGSDLNSIHVLAGEVSVQFKARGVWFSLAKRTASNAEMCENGHQVNGR